MSDMFNTIVLSPYDSLDTSLISISCSLACFKAHKPVHETSESAPTPSQPVVTSSEAPPPPAPTSRPRPVKTAPDFSQLSSNPRFQALISAHPSLLLSLQRVYAATLEPDSDNPRGGGGRGNYRGRGDRGGWRGRGGFAQDSSKPSWTQDKGDAKGMKLLARYREGEEGEEEEAVMAEFVNLVQELFGSEQAEDDTVDVDDGTMEIG